MLVDFFVKLTIFSVTTQTVFCYTGEVKQPHAFFAQTLGLLFRNKTSSIQICKVVNVISERRTIEKIKQEYEDRRSFYDWRSLIKLFGKNPQLAFIPVSFLVAEMCDTSPATCKILSDYKTYLVHVLNLCTNTKYLFCMIY